MAKITFIDYNLNEKDILTISSKSSLSSTETDKLTKQSSDTIINSTIPCAGRLGLIEVPCSSRLGSLM